MKTVEKILSFCALLYLIISIFVVVMFSFFKLYPSDVRISSTFLVYSGIALFLALIVVKSIDAIKTIHTMYKQ